MIRLTSLVGGEWVDSDGIGAVLSDPVNGEALAEVPAIGLDLSNALEHARTVGAPALSQMTYGARGALLRGIADTLAKNRAKYLEIALRNSGNTEADGAFDIDGAIGTLKYYAGLGRKLGEVQYLAEPSDEQLGRDENFRAVHIWTPLNGAAIHINAFNFPAWGLWEKAAVALLSGVPVVSKPATVTAWLAHEMVSDVVSAGDLPDGVLSLVVGGGRDLIDHVREGDVLSFTGSADTALTIQERPPVRCHSVRLNIEADSLNVACLGPEASAGSAEFQLLIREVRREMVLKAGQKCTAIRRILVPRNVFYEVVAAIEAEIGKIAVGDPRNPEVTMGPLVSKAQQRTALAGIGTLAREARLVVGSMEAYVPDGVDPRHGCFIAPTLLACEHPLRTRAIHEVEVFGPVATVMPYDNLSQAAELVRRGGGSLVASLFTADDQFAFDFVRATANTLGRVLVVDESVGKGSTGHGVVMPQCVHGGPGRAGGGEELGGLRGVRFYHQRTAVQASRSRIGTLRDAAAEVVL